MTISLTNTVNNSDVETILCAGDTRNSSGDPVGPQNLRIAETPGADLREYVGADRVEGDHVRCDSGSVSFGVTRTFADEAAALAWVSGSFISEAKSGVLKFGTTAVFGNKKSAVTQRVAAVVGCTVAVNYTIQG